MRFLLPLVALAAGAAAAGETTLRLNSPRFAAAAAAVSNRVYVTCGWGETGALSSIEEIDLDRGTVTLLPFHLAARTYHAAATWRDHVVLVGGRGDVTGFAALDLFHPSTGRVTPLPPLPRPRVAPAAAVAGDLLYVVGGQDAFGRRTGWVDIFDFTSQTWRHGPDMPTARECAVAVVGDGLYAFGGYDGFEPLAVVECFHLPTETWSAAPPLAAPQSGHRAIADGSTVYLFGDYTTLNRVAAGDPAAGTWRLLDIPFLRSRHNAAARVGDRFVVAGGNTRPTPPYLDAVQVFTREELQRAPAQPASEQAPPPPAIEAAELAIDRITQQLQSVSNAIIRGTWDWSYHALGTTWTATSPYELVFQRPNRLYLACDSIRVWCDGSTYVQDDARNGARTSTRAIGDLDVLLNRNAHMAIAAMPPGHRALLSRHQALGFRNECRSLRMARVQDATWNGRTALGLAIFNTNRPDHTTGPGFRIDVDPETGLTIAADSIPADEETNGPPACLNQYGRMARSLQFRFRAGEARVNTDIDPALFKPPLSPAPSQAARPVDHPLNLRHLQQHATWQRYRERADTAITAPVQLQWTNPVCRDFMRSSDSSIVNRLPPTHEVLVTRGALVVIRLDDGSEECRVPFPAATPDLPAAENWRLAWLPGDRAEDDVIAISEDGREVRAMDRAGHERWRTSREQNDAVQWLCTLPAGPGRARLLAACSSAGLVFHDGAGRSAGAITRHPADHIELADRDADGWVELTVFGLQTRRYEWLPPPP